MVACQNDPDWVSNVIQTLKLGRRDPISSNRNLKWTVGKPYDLDIMIDYINRFPHKTKKKFSFNKFIEVRERILKKEHYGDGFIEIKEICKEINPDFKNRV